MTHLKALGLILSAIFGVVILFFVFLIIAINGAIGPIYSETDLINNFEKRREEIYEVKKYIETKLPENVNVSIEFDKNKLAIFHVKKGNQYDNNWRLYYNESKTDSLLGEIGWTVADLKELKKKLKAANCISVSSRLPVTIGWQRSGMGLYYYKVFDHDLSDELIQEYNDSCTYIFYQDNIVLEYGGGAIGPQCFPGLKKTYPSQ